MLPSPSDLYYFTEVCQTLNLSRAAERLGISQPSLSGAIRRLETSLGIDLFLRTKNGVQLTKAGIQLHTHVRQLSHLWETVKAECLASSHEVQGQFTLGCHPSVAQCVLAPVLAKLMANYPRLQIHLKHDLSRKIVEEIINFTLDLGVVVNPVRHPDLVLQKLYDDEVTFWQAANYPQVHENKTIVCDYELAQTQKLLKSLEAQGIREYRLLLSSNLDVIASLTAQGCGIGILPRTVAQIHYQGRLFRVPDSPIVYDEICLAYRAQLRQVKALRIVVEEILALYTQVA